VRVRPNSEMAGKLQHLKRIRRRRCRAAAISLIANAISSHPTYVAEDCLSRDGFVAPLAPVAAGTRPLLRGAVGDRRDGRSHDNLAAENSKSRIMQWLQNCQADNRPGWRGRRGASDKPGRNASKPGSTNGTCRSKINRCESRPAGARLHRIHLGTALFPYECPTQPVNRLR
jgi:hypothetical protein